VRLADGDLRAVLLALAIEPGADVAVRPLAAGAYHEHAVLEVEGSALVLRRCLASQWDLAPAAQLAREEATLEALRPGDLAPEPHALIPDAPGGPLLVESLVQGRRFVLGDLPGLGVSLAAVHALRPEHLPLLDARSELMADGTAWLDRARRSGADTAAIAPLVELGRRADDAGGGPTPAPATLVHTDLNAGNMLVGADGVCRLVDWEAARVGDPAWDLAHAISPTTTQWDASDPRVLAPAEVQAFLSAYRAAAASPGDAAVARLPGLLDAVMFRALAWCLGFAAEARPGGGSLPDELAVTLTRFGAPTFIERCLGARAALGLG
jgi:aminoglycoside phosphotransferase (APT) family kinase protein